MRRIPKVILLIAIGLIFVVSAGRSRWFPQRDRVYRVAKIVDLQTLLLDNGKIVRLIGIAGLGTGDFGLSRKYADDLLNQAQMLMRRLLGEKDVRLEFDVRKKDSFGRLLVYCFTEDTFINARLLREGLAALALRPPNLRFEEVLREAQEKAREDKRGIWAEDEVISYVRAGKYVNQFRTVEGKVLSVRRGKKGYRLNFTKGARQPFYVIIFNNDIPLFSSNGIILSDAYYHKTIRVRGRITRYNQPCILVRHPSQIEVVE